MRPSNNLENKTFSDTSKSFFFLIGIHSMQRWTATTRHGVTKKKKKAQKILQATENLFRKNLQLKDVC